MNERERAGQSLPAVAVANCSAVWVVRLGLLFGGDSSNQQLHEM